MSLMTLAITVSGNSDAFKKEASQEGSIPLFMVGRGLTEEEQLK